MLQIQTIRTHRQKVIAGLAKRNIADADQLIDETLSLDTKTRKTQQEHETLLATINTLSREVGSLMKSGKKGEAETLRERIVGLKKKSTKLAEELNALRSRLNDLLYRIPNIPDEKTPSGKGEQDNKVVKKETFLPTLGAGALPHWELVKKYDIIDFELGNKVTGAGFPVYQGKGAKLQRALISFFLDRALAAGYHEVQPPILVNEASGYGTGQLPDKEGQMYHLEKNDFYLIPTAEVPITNLYRDRILAEKELPIRHVGYSPCFRREAGSWGSHVRGLNRLHQFDKVEIVEIHHPDRSEKALETMCAHVEGLLEALELPYRKMLLCGGDLGFNASLTYDMEVYAGGQRRWLEVSSVSNFEAFQAHRLKLRFKADTGGAQLLHTLNGSALALPRVVAALLENNQTNEGIRIPDALIPYTGFDAIP